MIRERKNVVEYHTLYHGCANHATEGKCFCPPSTAVTQRSLPTCSVANYVLHPCTLIACCKCTPSAVGAAVSASLCSVHVILTYWATVVGEVTSPSRGTMCHFCAPVHYTVSWKMMKVVSTNILKCQNNSFIVCCIQIEITNFIKFYLMTMK